MKFSGDTILPGVKFSNFILIFESALQQYSATALPVIIRASKLIGVARGHVPPRLTTIKFFQCTLTYTKSDSDYMSTVASCKNP